ncbi:MAG TPA: MarR family transcriptional regulator [Hyphomicrobiales bacterium]|nr:MarR family transcriptional regulator [Hyphomicrobiales bacterium]
MTYDNDPADATLALAGTVRRMVGRLGRRLRAEQGEAALAPAAVAVLGRLQRDGAATPAALAAGEFMLPQTLTRVLADLERQGFASRAPDPADGRRALIAITPAGTAALRNAVAARDRWLAAALAATLSPTEQELVRLAAERLLAVAGDAP